MVNFPTNKQYIAIIDFEATCSKKGEVPRSEMEIIEFACIIINSDLQLLDEFTEFIHPQLHPNLTNFCTQLTTITQKDVDTADNFSNVLIRFNAWKSPYNPLFASWGCYDKKQLLQDCKLHNKKFPFDEEHLDLKRWLPQYLGISKPKGISSMLKYLNINFKGTPHRGIDDVKNILEILKYVYPLLPE